MKPLEVVLAVGIVGALGVVAYVALKPPPPTPKDPFSQLLSSASGLAPLLALL